MLAEHRVKSVMKWSQRKQRGIAALHAQQTDPNHEIITRLRKPPADGMAHWQVKGHLSSWDTIAIGTS
jgi:hypothetical protein